jgi:hypothetical protein
MEWIDDTREKADQIFVAEAFDKILDILTEREKYVIKKNILGRAFFH